MASAPKTVLVVDDDRDMLDLVATVVEDAGFRVRTAANGHEALRAVESAMPDLILLDLKMPIMDGRQFLREFRARYDSSIPIVLCTASEDPRRLALELDAADGVEKSFDIDALVEVVERHLGPA